MGAGTSFSSSFAHLVVRLQRAVRLDRRARGKQAASLRNKCEERISAQSAKTADTPTKPILSVEQQRQSDWVKRQLLTFLARSEFEQHFHLRKSQAEIRVPSVARCGLSSLECRHELRAVQCALQSKSAGEGAERNWITRCHVSAQRQ